MPLAYVNLVGGQDELVFDGDSLVVDRDGTVLARAATVRRGGAGRRRGGPRRSHPPSNGCPTSTEVYRALVCGLEDYVRKNGFRSVILGLSGGIDSALTAAIAVDALGAGSGPRRRHAQRLLVASTPGTTLRTSRGALGCRFREVPIASMVDAYLAALPLTGLAEENLQARVRGTALMGLSNQEGHLVLATGNKSELSVGLLHALRRRRRRLRTTQGRAQDPGVGAGPLAQRCGRRGAARRHPSPRTASRSRPSAELRPGQLDTDSLPDYDGARRRARRLRRAGPRGVRPGRRRVPRATSSSASSPSRTAPSTSAASTRRDRRSRSRRSDVTAGCRSPAGGAKTSTPVSTRDRAHRPAACAALG